MSLFDTSVGYGRPALAWAGLARHSKSFFRNPEYVVGVYAEAITHCAQVGDYTTRKLLEESVQGEEMQIDWLETQLTTIAQIGLQNYLAQEMHGA